MFDFDIGSTSCTSFGGSGKQAFNRSRGDPAPLSGPYPGHGRWHVACGCPALCPPFIVFGDAALCVDAGDALHGGSGAITANDVLYVISKGGYSDEVNKCARIAKTRGAKVVAQTENIDSPLAELSDAVFQVKTEFDVDPFGMVATGSSLVNCAAGDVLCVLLLELKGYSRDAFSQTHPGGAVGLKIQHEM
ncbi:MAG: SIS domain-containing protein [Anaerolineales bacterium]|nr:MAG: SIS domain-containing protein [Anaerolineales bacterium]